MEILFGILTGVIMTASEVVIDKKLWKTKPEKEKIISNSIRAAIIVLATVAAWIFGLGALSFSSIAIATFTLIFDWTLNVSRWKRLPMPYNWRIGHGVAMNKWQRILWAIRKVTAKFFYHGGEDTKSPWDKVFQRIPPVGEVLIKGILFGVAIYFGL